MAIMVEPRLFSFFVLAIIGQMIRLHLNLDTNLPVAQGQTQIFRVGGEG